MTSLYKSVLRKDGETVYLIEIPQNATDKSLSISDEVIIELSDKLEKLEKENNQLKEYASHKNDCAIIFDEISRLMKGNNYYRGLKCTCGLDKLLKDTGDEWYE